MALETVTYISDLVVTNPLGSDSKASGDDHLRAIKTGLKNTFPSVTGAVTKTHTEINSVTDRGLIAGQAWTGAHTFPTQTSGDNSTLSANTAFVAAAIASVNAQSALVVAIVAGTSQTAVAGSHYILTGAATTVTLPAAPASGDTVWVTVANALFTNVIARNGLTIMGLAENLTIDNNNATVELRYVNTSWRLV